MVDDRCARCVLCTQLKLLAHVKYTEHSDHSGEWKSCLKLNAYYLLCN